MYSCLLYQKWGYHMCVGLSLGFLSCSIDLYFCFCASTIQSWLLWLCSIVWSLVAWFLQLHFSFSRLLWLFGVSCHLLFSYHSYCSPHLSIPSPSPAPLPGLQPNWPPSEHMELLFHPRAFTYTLPTLWNALLWLLMWLGISHPSGQSGMPLSPGHPVQI